MQGQCENCTRRFFVPGAGVEEVACPSCGGQMQPERDQPSGVNSDGDLRNMVDPYTGVDQGGSPDTEGILGGDRTQAYYKRDESFASVKQAAQTGQATPSMPAGLHNGPMKALNHIGATINGMAPGNKLYLWNMSTWLPEARKGNLQPVTVEVSSDHPAYLAAAIGIVNKSTECNNNYIPVPEFKTLIEGISGGSIPPPGKQAKVAGPDDFGLDGWVTDEDDDGGGAPADKFIIDGQGTVYSLPEPTHHEQIAESAGLPMDSFPKGLSLGVINSDGSTEWYQHGSGLKPAQMAESLEAHFQKPVTIDPTLKPSSSEERFGIEPGAKANGRGELQILQDPPAPRSYGTPLDRNEGLVRGGHLDQTIHMPYYAMEKEAILPLAVPAAAAAARMGAPLIAKNLAPGLMKGAMGRGQGLASKGLKALGVHGLIKGIGGAGGGGAAPQGPVQAPTLQQVTHVIADVETPSSIPALHENDGDTKQFKDQSNDSMNLDHPNMGESGGSMGAHGPDGDTPASALLDHLLPKVLEYYDSDDEGANDPLLKALDEALERENPGYKDGDDDDPSALEEFFSELINSHKEAAGQFYPGVGVAPGMQPGVLPGVQQPGMQTGLPPGSAIVPNRNPGAPVGPQPAANACPGCGSQMNPDGSCAQCGFGAQNQITPDQVNQAVTPGTSVGGPSVASTKVADTQGPYSPEQYKMVAQVLLETGRQDEIPHMYDAPWEYADILAQVQNKVNQPPPAVPEPAQPPGPPMDPAMDPSMMDPSMAPPDPSQIQASIRSAVARFSADNIAPKCPKCESHTTETLPEADGSATFRCHNCGNGWEGGEVVKTGEVAEHPHDQPILDHSDMTDTTDSPHPDAENNLTWQTPDGQPLVEGQEYEMHSEDYSIPDVVRIDQVKPNELVYTITGEYSELEDQNTISPEDVDLQGIKFLPVGGEDQVEETPENVTPDAGIRDPITTSSWNGRLSEVPAKVAPPKEASWLLEGTNISAAPAPWEEPLPDLTGGPVAPSKEDRDWLVADLPRTAGAKFSPNEQREFVDEDGEARNLDRLDIEDTHYKTKETSTYVAGRNATRCAQPDMVNDDHLVFGL